jgi:hypothetical protein
MRWQSGREGRLAQEEKEKENRRKNKECNGAGVKIFGLMDLGIRVGLVFLMRAGLTIGYGLTRMGQPKL